MSTILLREIITNIMLYQYNLFPIIQTIVILIHCGMKNKCRLNERADLIENLLRVET